MTPRTAADIIDSLRRGEAIHDAIVNELIDLRLLADGDEIHFAIKFVRCQLHSLDAVKLEFHRRMTLIDTQVWHSSGSFAFSYFFEGFTIERCDFVERLDFSCGTHNRNGHAVIIRDSLLHDFVDFFDCTFEGPVEVVHCRFEIGTNLLYAGDMIRFDVPPVIEENIGEMDRGVE
jgi:hypothetical protein